MLKCSPNSRQSEPADVRYLSNLLSLRTTTGIDTPPDDTMHDHQDPVETVSMGIIIDHFRNVDVTNWIQMILGGDYYFPLEEEERE